MGPRWLIGDSRRNAALLAATVVCLAATIIAGYLTRQRIVEKGAWVAHTDEVKLAIAECELALARDDDAKLLAAEGTVKQLTSDNSRQQENVSRAIAGAGRTPFPRDELEALFTTMRTEENRLMVLRRGEMAAAQQRSAVVFLAAAALTILFGWLAWTVQGAQRRSLAVAHEAMARQRALLEGIIESVEEGIIAVDTSRKTLAINAVARAIVGEAFPRKVLPEDWRPAVTATYEDGSPMPPADGPLARAMRGESPDGVVYQIIPAGQQAGTWVSTTARPIRDEQGHVVAAVATLRDITQQRASAQHLRDLSLTDELTGLLNRRGFLAAANERIAVARRTGDPMALLYADLNGLKRINDDLGHEEGDRAIADTGHVLRGVFRDRDVVARIGGDEFVALLPNFAPSACDALLERLSTTLRSHAEREKRLYRLSLSAGVTFMDHARRQSLDDLLADADRTMYERKRGRAGESMPVVRAVEGAPR